MAGVERVADVNDVADMTLPTYKMEKYGLKPPPARGEG
jgi:hypothetical protein